MIRVIYRNSKGNTSIDVPQTHWKTAMRDVGGLVWVDFGEEAPEAIEPIWREVFGFHALAIEDALRERHVPKVDNWGDYVYIVLRTVAFDPKQLKLVTQELDVFLGRTFLVTHHKQPLELINRVWSASQSDPRRLERGPDHLLYELLDQLASDYMPAVDALDDAIDQLEDEVFEKPTQHTLNTIFSIKRAVLYMRRIIVPQREVLNRLARDEYAMIDPNDRVYFRDVYDHFVRLVDINENLRDLVGGALDTYLSVSANRTNEVMKVLTVTSVLFMPISFWAGFFGMNFTRLPFDGWEMLIVSLILMVISPAILFGWFKRNGWL